MSVGSCIYCGQIGAIEVGNQEAALKIATKLCDCKEAREARRQEEMDEEDAEYRKTAIERACHEIGNMFGDESEETTNMESVNEEVMAELMVLVVMIIDKKLNEIQIKLPNGARGKISKNANGNTVIQRSKGLIVKKEI